MRPGFGYDVRSDGPGSGECGSLRVRRGGVGGCGETATPVGERRRHRTGAEKFQEGDSDKSGEVGVRTDPEERNGRTRRGLADC